MTNQQDTNPAEDSSWHRQPTVWLVLGILAFTVVSSIALLIIAANNAPEIIERAPVGAEAPR